MSVSVFLRVRVDGVRVCFVCLYIYGSVNMGICMCM